MPSSTSESQASKVAANYRQIADVEAKGHSTLYQELAAGVAASERLLDFIGGLPEAKQQPNLVFGAVRHLYGDPRGIVHLEALVDDHSGEIRKLIFQRSTQTNEPGRCATLLPILAQIPEPIALLEVGAAAGLCLLPDYYGYQYDEYLLPPKVSVGCEALIFPCDVIGNMPLPTHIPEIAWRAGLDLNPIDVMDVEECRWLETLVWPGQSSRLGRLRHSIDVARKTNIQVEQGDLLGDLWRVAESAPKETTLVVFHSAVLAYVDPIAREEFAKTMLELNVVWVSNEGVNVLPWLDKPFQPESSIGSFLLSINEVPVALTGPHGQYIHWKVGKRNLGSLLDI